MVRISEIEVRADDLEGYRLILEEEAAASVEMEPGVVAILPMYEREHPTRVRILEVYASREAYESHLQTPHFRKYKATTIEMVESLRLVDMETVEATTLSTMLRKMPASQE